jgi:hypothetical protein
MLCSRTASKDTGLGLNDENVNGGNHGDIAHSLEAGCAQLAEHLSTLRQMVPKQLQEIQTTRAALENSLPAHPSSDPGTSSSDSSDGARGGPIRRSGKGGLRAKLAKSLSQKSRY